MRDSPNHKIMLDLAERVATADLGHVFNEAIVRATEKPDEVEATALLALFNSLYSSLDNIKDYANTGNIDLVVPEPHWSARLSLLAVQSIEQLQETRAWVIDQGDKANSDLNPFLKAFMSRHSDDCAWAQAYLTDEIAKRVRDNLSMDKCIAGMTATVTGTGNKPPKIKGE